MRLAAERSRPRCSRGRMKSSVTRSHHSQLEKGRRDVRRLVSVLMLLLVLSTALAGCGFAGARPASVTSTPGFFVGIWDGLIAPWTLLLRAFLDIRMYAVPNSGWWYDAGFLFGMAGSVPLGWIAALIAIAQHVF